jgi:plastocyanin
MQPTAPATRPSAAHWLLVPLLAAVLALGACGGSGAEEETQPSSTTTSESSTGSGSPDSSSPTKTSPSPSAEEGQRIEVTFEGGQVTPNGERVQVEAGEEVTFVVTADAPGSLHVHSTPEAELAYEAGTSRHSLTIDQPGVAEVESHELGVVVVQLEVR